MYFNTTETTGSQLNEYTAKACNQNDLIMTYFEDHPGKHTPSQVQQAVLPGAPITSVRRAITTLTDHGKLRKTTEQITGPYGRPEYLWKLPTTQGELF